VDQLLVLPQSPLYFCLTSFVVISSFYVSSRIRLFPGMFCLFMHLFHPLFCCHILWGTKCHTMCFPTPAALIAPVIGAKWTILSWQGSPPSQGCVGVSMARASSPNDVELVLAELWLRRKVMCWWSFSGLPCCRIMYLLHWREKSPPLMYGLHLRVDPRLRRELFRGRPGTARRGPLMSLRFYTALWKVDCISQDQMFWHNCPNVLCAVGTIEYTECWPCPLFDILINKYFRAG
jgi:hypothetical protein